MACAPGDPAERGDGQAIAGDRQQQGGHEFTMPLARAEPERDGACGGQHEELCVEEPHLGVEKQQGEDGKAGEEHGETPGVVPGAATHQPRRCAHKQDEERQQ